MLDGAYNLDNYFPCGGAFPNPEATQEFTVLNNTSTHVMALPAGGRVSIVTKSGTNDWHGDVFEFYRSGGFNAKDYFTHATNKIHRNQFGGSLGGPIIKDKFFLSELSRHPAEPGHDHGNRLYTTSDMVNNGNFWGFCVSGFDGNGICRGPALGA